MWIGLSQVLDDNFVDLRQLTATHQMLKIYRLVVPATNPFLSSYRRTHASQTDSNDHSTCQVEQFLVCSFPVVLGEINELTLVIKYHPPRRSMILRFNYILQCFIDGMDVHVIVIHKTVVLGVGILFESYVERALSLIVVSGFVAWCSIRTHHPDLHVIFVVIDQ